MGASPGRDREARGAGEGAGSVVFVNLWFSDAVAAIDVQTRKVVSNMQFERGGGPKRIAIGRRVN